MQAASNAKEQFKPPVRVDINERVIPPLDKVTRVWRWRLNTPASIAGTRQERLYLGKEKKAEKQSAELFDARRAAGDLTEKLKERGMSFTDAICYAINHAPKGQGPVWFDLQRVSLSRGELLGRRSLGMFERVSVAFQVAIRHS
jgi:hypothetical protein